MTKISNYSPFLIIIISSIFVSFLSFMVVYLLTTVCEEEHSLQLFKFSIIMPLITTPVIVAILIRSSKYLKHIKKEIEKEIEKNKKKDVILFEQARFVLMGEMLANISHQWKQPLNTINLAVLSSKTSAYNKEDLSRNFDIMEDNVNYLATTIDDFMSFFDQKTHNEVRDILSIIKEIKSIIGSQIENREITLDIQIDSVAKETMVASSISQVILNLLNNSKDAFSEDDSDTDKTITLKFSVKDYVLEIVCCDNGKGIPLEIEEKIFDPYFTTKNKSQGTGIGLYMSKQIVQKLFNGTITINSREPKLAQYENQTCFFLEIPYSDKCVLKESLL